ncbi:LysR family transcriptional regulator [Oleiagrimonas sp. C23AA]|uniref:LysR family transcriptional regulator n=1 Tax=Oleiagrimonas sp. C23AA TaxID=2719047 RepID=UPI00141EC980|nr:LysR family transcriptional regulator [Oleiagrimonas sp. C23AA]NII10700.1 LysR family transcriptional regulator [Oleiagrimonas sp. C23AA]
MRSWDPVQAFVAAVRLGSFSAAAREQGVSTAFISRAVRALEARLDTQLLHRTTRRLHLTEAGRVYYDRVSELLHGFDSAEAELASFQQSLQGELHISLATTYGERYVAPHINVFARRHPQLQIRMDFSNRVVDLIEHGYDLALRTGPVDTDRLEAIRLGQRRLYVVAAPAYLQAHGTPQRPADLRRHRCLIGSSPQWSFAHDRRLTVEGDYQASSGLALVDAARRGMGLAQLPDFYVEDALEEGALVPVLEPFAANDGAVWLVTPRSRHRAPKVSQLITWLCQHVSETPWRQP